MGISSKIKNKAVFFDRDGVINKSVIVNGKPYPPSSLDELVLVDGVMEGIEHLKKKGYKIFIVTNQPDVGRGKTKVETVRAIHKYLENNLAIDEVYCCYHGSDEECTCRKPKPGMILDAFLKWNIDPVQSYMIGDRWRDIEAGNNAGIKSLLVDYNYEEKKATPYFSCKSTREAIQFILNKNNQMGTIESLKVKIFADGADKQGMLDMYAKPYIKGLTTNPTLMKKAGIKDYEHFSKDILQLIPDRPISLEVFSDDIQEMERQALKIASWGDNVYVKLPVTNTKRESTNLLVKKLSDKGVKVNVTAIMTLEQVRDVVLNLNSDVASYVSVFAGRIADTGIDPVPLMEAAVALCSLNKKAELIWASPRELLNIFQADQIGCHVITVTNDILKKLEIVGYNLEDYSLDTVKMFYNDAVLAGFTL